MGQGEDKESTHIDCVGDGMGLRIFPNVLGLQYMKGRPSLNLVSVRFHCLVNFYFQVATPFLGVSWNVKLTFQNKLLVLPSDFDCINQFGGTTSLLPRLLIRVSMVHA